MNKRHYEHTLPNIRGSLSNTYTGYSEEDYIRLSEEKYMGHAKTTKTSSKNKF